MNKDLIDLCLRDDLSALDVSTEPDKKQQAIAAAANLPIFKDVATAMNTTAWNDFFTAETPERACQFEQCGW